jgi:hypothetical protein
MFSIGCSSSYKVSQGPSSDISYEQIQNKLRDEEVEIQFHDHKSILAKQVHFSRDTISFIDIINDSSMRIPINSVDLIIRRLHSDGAVEGLIFGTLSGTIAGGLLSAVVIKPTGEFSGFATIGYGLGGACLGAIIGTTYGGTQGHYIEYKFVPN